MPPIIYKVFIIHTYKFKFIDLFAKLRLHLSGGHTKLPAEGAVEGGVVLKSTAGTGILRRHAPAQHTSGGQQPLLGDVLVDGEARQLLESAHKVVAAGVGLPGQHVHGQVAGEIVVDIR